MANVFLSYARSDVAKAERIALALEAASHSVWWDREIHAGSRFAGEIEEALNSADFVVVLWSPHSIKSVWVHDEAAAGRDSGKLIPVLIDKVVPPLGFRQFQTIDLKGKLRNQDAAKPLLDALSGKHAAGRASSTFVRRAEGWHRIGWKAPAAAIAVALLILAGWFFLLRERGDGADRLLVVAADGGDPALSSQMAQTIATDLRQFRAGPLGALSIASGENNEKGAGYRIEIRAAKSGDDVRTDVALWAPGKSTTLWEASVEGRAESMVDVRQQTVAKIGDALACAIEVERNARKIDARTLGLYVDGCSISNDLVVFESDQGALSIFRQVTKRAPDFAPGWANLALLEWVSLPGVPPSEQPEQARLAREHLAVAKRLDPSLPMVFAAQANVYPNDGTKAGRAIDVLDRGLALHPDDALLRSTRSGFLQTLGRMTEAIDEAEKALQLNPMSPANRDAYISALAYAGRTEAAFKELRKAEAIWPGSAALDQTRYRLDLRYGDPKAALRKLQERGSGDLQPLPEDTAWHAFIEARIHPTPARINAALDAFRQRHRRNPVDVPGFIQALGTFGRVDEAFAAVALGASIDSLIPSTDLFFRPHMRSIRLDPRFIGLAYRLGLLTYWRKSDVWPDFCSEPRLPYDCKVEGAKYPLGNPPYPPEDVPVTAVAPSKSR